MGWWARFWGIEPDPRPLDPPAPRLALAGLPAPEGKRWVTIRYTEGDLLAHAAVYGSGVYGETRTAQAALPVGADIVQELQIKEACEAMLARLGPQLQTEVLVATAEALMVARQRQEV